MRRTLGAAFLNRVANDPAVRPWVGGDGELDLTAIVSNPANIALINEHGGFIFERHDAGRYEGHTMFLPSGRGRAVRPAAMQAFRYIFTRTDASEIVTKVPESNPAADIMARRCGMEPSFRREAAWSDGAAVTFMVLTLERWRALDDSVATEGEAFHTALEVAKREVGSTLPTHPHDEAHERAVGAAILMARAGQARKSVWSYNRWARFAGYAPIELLSEVPPVVDIQDAVFTVNDGALEVLKCR